MRRYPSETKRFAERRAVTLQNAATVKQASTAKAAETALENASGLSNERFTQVEQRLQALENPIA